MWWVEVSTCASVKIDILMGTCRGGISLWGPLEQHLFFADLVERQLFCAQQCQSAEASELVGSALYSHERPDAFDSVLLSFQDDDTKAKVSVISLSQQLSRVSLVHRELPLWHLFTQRKGSKKAQACPGSHRRGVASSSQCTLYCTTF